MKSISHRIAAILVAGLSVPAWAAVPESDFLPALGRITAESIAGHVRVLASDAFEGRLPSTPGEKKTTDYIEARFREAGVAMPPGGSYLQDVPLVCRTLQGSPEAAVHMEKKTFKLEAGKDFVAGTTRMTGTVSMEKSPLVFVGFGIVAPEYGWDDYAGIDVKEKTVLVLQGDPGRTSTDSTFFKGATLTVYGTSSFKQEEAARHGAAGMLTIHDPEVLGYPFEALSGSMRRPRFDNVPNPDTPARPDFAGALRKEVAAELLRRSRISLEDLTAAAQKRGFKAVDLGQTFSVSLTMKVERSVSHNVVGWIPGGERADEFVVFTAHWDHVGIGVPVDGDSIYNGAVDNATGTATLIELSRAWRALPSPPKRSVVFVAMTAEEQGLLGSYHYADHPVFPLEKTVAVLNMDALFPYGAFDGMTTVGLGSSELEDYMREAARAEGRILTPDPSPEMGAFFRSDHYPLARKGVPALFAVGGPVDDSDTTMSARFNDYITNRYHRPSDEIDDTWDLRGIVGDARIYFRTGLAIASDDRVPNWYLNSEFRAIRDRMMAGSRGAGRPGAMGGW